MNKEAIYEFLKATNVDFEIDDHEAVFNMEELGNVDLAYPGRDAKNLFIRDDKKRTYYLISIMGHKRLDLKVFRKTHETRPLTFASENDLNRILGLDTGSVGPMGLLNDKDAGVIFYLDKDFLEGNGLIGIHPNDNTATIWIKTQDLVDIIQDHGNQVYLVDFEG